MSESENKDMSIEIPEIFNELIGLDCCEARVGYADSLVIGFGEKIFDSPSDKCEFYPEWQLRTESCMWRVIKNQDMYCGCYDYEEENDDLLKNLLTLKVLDIVQISNFDIEIILEKEYRIALLGQSIESTHFGILAPNDISIEFSSKNEWIISDSNTPLGLSAEEELLSDHSEICFERWEKIIPKSQDKTHCSKCIYFRPLRGEFYFWDYGICSNGNSEFDGKLVGVESGCENYGDDF